MGAEQKWGRGQQKVVVSAAQMATGVDAYGGDNETTGQIAFRREAHRSNVAVIAWSNVPPDGGDGVLD